MLDWQRVREWCLNTLIGIVMLLVFGGCVYTMHQTDMDEQRHWETDPCSVFANHRVEEIPARCLSEFKEGVAP